MARLASALARLPGPSHNGAARIIRGLPAYAPLLLAFHEEFAVELQAMLDCLPLASDDRGLDVACGDGQFSVWLARKVPDGSVTAVDASRPWLQVARQTARSQKAANVELRQADARRLPFRAGAFDFVWCAQSLYCLPDVMHCLAEMVRVLRPGGLLAILEDDTLHHVLLPWPIDLELEFRAAEHAAFRQEAVGPTRFYVGRWTRRLLRHIGLVKIQEHAFSAARQPPLSGAAKKFFAEYLTDLRQRVLPLLANQSRRRLEQLTDPANRRYLLRQRDFSAVLLDRLVFGFRPQK